MANILVNGLKAKTGGGRSILTNYLSLLSGSSGNHRYYVLTPSPEEYCRYESEKIHIVDIPSLFKRNILFPVLYAAVFPGLLRKYGIDLILNFGDIVIPTRTRQVYLFDWAYAIYPESITWQRMPGRERLVRRAKVFFIKHWIRSVATTIAQTEVAGDRLRRQYGLRSVKVVPNAISLENLGSGEDHDFGLPKGRNLLCLTYYYTHKNLEIFVPLAKRILAERLDYRIVLTLEVVQDPGAAALLQSIRSEGLEGAFVNVGPVPMAHVPSLYRQCDGLIMPTLLESFSGTYVEAMYHGKPVFTSDLDFARAVCGGCAWYFDPMDADSILGSLERAFGAPEEMGRLVEEGRRRVAAMPGWQQTFSHIQEILAKTAMDAWEPQ